MNQKRYIPGNFTAKIPYGENSLRRNFPTAKIPYGKKFARRKLHIAKNPTVKNLTAKNLSAKIPSAQMDIFSPTKIVRITNCASFILQIQAIERFVLRLIKQKA